MQCSIIGLYSEIRFYGITTKKQNSLIQNRLGFYKSKLLQEFFKQPILQDDLAREYY